MIDLVELFRGTCESCRLKKRDGLWGNITKRAKKQSPRRKSLVPSWLHGKRISRIAAEHLPWANDEQADEIGWDSDGSWTASPAGTKQATVPYTIVIEKQLTMKKAVNVYCLREFYFT